MKQVILYSALIALSFSSCNTLDLNPLSEGSSETWYTNEDEIQMSVIRLFHQDFWKDVQFVGDQDLKDEYTDNFTRRTSLTAITNATINGQSSFVTSLWKRAYKNIAAANLIISNIQRTEGIMSEEKIAMYRANARFSRACMYGKLIFLYGDVPYYTENIDIDDFYSLGRTPKLQILEEIYKDFDYAIENLPVSYNSNSYQFATKGAAYAMKARVALYMGNYAIARDAANSCINLGKYELYPDYEKLFYPETKNSVETIFCTPRAVEQKIIFPDYVLRCQISRIIGGWNNGGPSWDLFCSYLCTDGLPIDESPLFDPHNPFRNRDPRLKATMAEFGSEYLGLIYQPHPDSLQVLNVKTGEFVENKDSRGVDQYASYNGLIAKKGMNESCLSYQVDPDNIVMRYADVLLMYAESKIELNEIDQSVLNVMNQVRARAYANESSYPVISTTDQNELRKILRIERRMEFAWEGTRYEDIIRWRLAEKVLNTPMYGMLDPESLRENVVNKGGWFFPEIPPIDEDGTVDFSGMYNKGLVKLLTNRKFDAPKQYLWPIPTTEILINSNMTQNDGY
ncbi:RagB/SusD family nutrient uptake outer membrane protein [Parabacteroides acidifaciens]|uniref:RagB/SusD family nutrient uptake outer membrane protein n=1 Tax=Parabacteroides acidifaciens TaxID=2290935 RepID=A0A3D8HB14_9BACT|nr:RagB/SusD family nutrient uptake outer membrane protein [Parabacteroides acidifaciens]MBC8603119.1 RagB/SusD family nutrient uptake outer membrane protein [Parabacteroides acidifaciens]RDU48176.1 RagB/SusD family nutrient uptake outer membrane protein [Parabacteroides acidifaciens]